PGIDREVARTERQSLRRPRGVPVPVVAGKRERGSRNDREPMALVAEADVRGDRAGRGPRAADDEAGAPVPEAGVPCDRGFARGGDLDAVGYGAAHDAA